MGIDFSNMNIFRLGKISFWHVGLSTITKTGQQTTGLFFVNISGQWSTFPVNLRMKFNKSNLNNQIFMHYKVKFNLG